MAVVFPRSSPDVYQPLGENEIRLLTVSPGQLDDPVRCTLEQVTLLEESPPRYETISYCWGDATLQAQMQINDLLADVTFSAHAAIRCMRRRDAERRLWIDAICINQADLVERSSQVTLMGRIYRNAVGNLIHLEGPDDLDTSEVRITLQDIKERTKQRASVLAQSPRVGFSKDMLAWDFDGSKLFNQKDLRVLHSLYALPWFRRVWVVQESALAKTNICHWGTSTFPLYDVLMTAWSLSSALLSAPDEYFESRSFKNFWISGLRSFIRPDDNEHGSQADIFIQIIVDLEASERRDRVFGFRDLLTRPRDAGQSLTLLETDYQKPVMHVYRDATRYLLQQYATGSQALNKICHRSDRDIHLDGKTSWTYCFDRPFDPDLDAIPFNNAWWRSGVQNKSTTAEPWFGLLVSGDPDVLSIEAVLVGSITLTDRLISPSMLQDYEVVRALVEAVLAASTHIKLSGVHPPRTTLFRRFRAALDIKSREDKRPVQSVEHGAVAQLLSATTGFDTFPNDEMRLEAFQAFLADLRASSSLPCKPEDLPKGLDKKTRDCSQAFKSFRDTALQRRLCHIDNGSIGIGPKIMRQGDVVVMCTGVKTPLVLRPVKGGQYEFIGAISVTGGMRGEFLNMGLEMRTFDLV